MIGGRSLLDWINQKSRAERFMYYDLEYLEKKLKENKLGERENEKMYVDRGSAIEWIICFHLFSPTLFADVNSSLPHIHQTTISY